MSHLQNANPLTSTTEADVEILRGVPARYDRLAAELGKRIIGQEEVIRDLFVALAVQGHVLMIGVPGLAKTLLVRCLAEILDLPVSTEDGSDFFSLVGIGGGEDELRHGGRRSLRLLTVVYSG